MNDATLLAAAGAGLITLGILNVIAFLIVRDLRRALSYMTRMTNATLRLQTGLAEETKKLNKVNTRQGGGGGFKRNRFTDRGEGGR